MTDRTDGQRILENVRIPTSMIKDSRNFDGDIDADCFWGDLIIHDKRVVGMQRTKTQKRAPKMILPKLTECHVHLDKCHTVSRIGAVGGDLPAAINAQRTDKKYWTRPDIQKRSSKGLEELIASGCGTVRSHVDWNGGSEILQPPLAWDVLTELASQYRSEINLQISPLLGVDDLAEPNVAENVARIIAEKSKVMGVFVLDHANRRKGILAAFHAAEKFGLMLDFHVDEGLAIGLNGLELIADAVIERGFEGTVLCGHACALINLKGDAWTRTAEKIAKSGIHVACLPTTNLYLQGRTEGTPDRRGITRIKELKAANVPVVLGTDNVCDAFCPMGRHDPRQSLMLASLVAHLDPPFGEFLPMITTTAQSALGLDPVFVDTAELEGLMMFSAASTSDLLANPDAPLPLIPKFTGVFA
ncbi:MAG: amidohydrolase family protein [Pseudomonadota bacterium]